MFRLPLFSSLFALSTAATTTTGGKNSIAEFQRALQLDLDSFQFNFAGININAELAQTECPAQWGPTLSCVATKCPQFQEVCPDLDIPDEFQGTARK